MIQRIQTVYLIISIVLTGLLFLLPFAEIAKDGAIYLFNFKGILLDGVLKVNGIAIPVLLVVIMALHGLAIFGYKNRPRQTRVIVFAILALLVLIGLFIYFTYLSFSGVLISFKFGTGDQVFAACSFPLLQYFVDTCADHFHRIDRGIISKC